MPSDLDTARTRFAEKVGVFFEKQGAAPMLGRIYGWLLVCWPEEQTAAQLAEQLSVSRASVSTTTRQLEEGGLIERLRVPGERTIRYRIPAHGSVRHMEASLMATVAFIELLDEGLALLAGTPPEVRRRLEDNHGFHAFMRREIPLLIRRWERETGGVAHHEEGS